VILKLLGFTSLEISVREPSRVGFVDQDRPFG
jgi:hypothetical protein